MTDDEFDQLVEQSSLGTPGAKALRRRGAELAIRRLAREHPEYVAEVLREMGYEVTPP